MSRGLLRYAGVGALATAAHYAVLVLAVEAGHWPAWLGAGVGAVVGAQLAYAGNRRFTFGASTAPTAPTARMPAPTPGIDQEQRWLPSWWRFQLAAALGALSNMVIVAAAVLLGAHYLLAQLLATGAVLLLTYEINRRWTFAVTRG